MTDNCPPTVCDELRAELKTLTAERQRMRESLEKAGGVRQEMEAQITSLHCDVRRLEEELEVRQIVIASLHRYNEIIESIKSKYVEQMQQLMRERDKYKAALQFYANEKHYDEDAAPGNAVFSGVALAEPTEYDFEPDLGHRAPVALEPHPDAQQPTGETTAGAMGWSDAQDPAVEPESVEDREGR